MREQRKNFRVEWNSSAKIYDHDGRLTQQCVVRNFSNSGARIVGVESRTVPDEFILRISPHGRIHHLPRHLAFQGRHRSGIYA